MIVQGSGTPLLGPKAAGESKVATFDFADEVAAGATLVSAVVTATWAGGTYDANPSAVISGADEIDGLTVLQALAGGLAGAVYTITATATDSNAEVHVITAQLVIEPAASYAAWADFVPMVLAHAKECPYPLVEQHVTEAAEEFCRRSRAWRSSKVTLLTTQAGVDAYQLASQANGEVHAIHSAWALGQEIDVLLPGDADDTEPAKTGNTWAIGLEPGSIARLTPAPITAGVVVTGAVSYAPTRWALGIPRELFQRWGREIADGAAAKIVMQGGKPWSNEGAYNTLKGCFEGGITQASNEAGPVQRVRNRLRVRPVA